MSRGAFPPPPKSVRIWVVNENAEPGASASANLAAQAGARPALKAWVIFAVFAVVIGVVALAVIARLVQNQLGR